MEQEQLVATAIRIAKKFIKPQENIAYLAYPDPSSVLSKTLSNMGKLSQFKEGKFALTDDLRKLSGCPWTVGVGCTGDDIKEGTLWTPEQVEEVFDAQVRIRVLDVLKSAPNLLKHSPEKLAACVSLQYNIGATAFKNSTVAKCLSNDDLVGAARAFSLFNKAKGQISQGLINRRNSEIALFNSVNN